MSRFIPHTDMTAAQLVECSRQALAILRLCECAAWELQNEANPDPDIPDAIGQGQKLAMDLLEPVHAALERHEGVPATAPARMVGGERNARGEPS